MTIARWRGAEVVYPLRSIDTLSRNILGVIGEEGQIMREYYQRRLSKNPSKDYYYIMRETPNKISLLIEYGFIDNLGITKLPVRLRRDCSKSGSQLYWCDGSLENTYTLKRGNKIFMGNNELA